MKNVHKRIYPIELPSDVEAFYIKIAENAGFSVEKVLSDALVNTAQELALRAMILNRKQKREHAD